MIRWALPLLVLIVGANVLVVRSDGIRDTDVCPQGLAAIAEGPARPPEEVRTRLADLRLINYYPSASAQTNMWSRWDAAAIGEDFKRIAGLHANAVRIVLFPHTFGYPRPRQDMVQHLSELMALAQQHGLRVQLTLFGFWSTYQDVTGSEAWAACVLAPYRDDARVAFIDLYNELDNTNPRALEWARTMVPRVRGVMGDIPITVSVSGAHGPEGLRRLESAEVPLDFNSLHFYGKPALARTIFREAALISGPRPLFIGETGYPTNPPPYPDRPQPQSPDDRAQLGTLGATLTWSFPERDAGSAPSPHPRDREWLEIYQDQYLRTVQHAALTLGLPSPAPWILNDFVPGAFPPESRSGLNQSEYFYGLYRTDGSAKPSAESIRAIFQGGVVDTSFNQSFEQGVPSGLPANWMVWEPGCATFARDPQVAFRGTAAARLTGSTACPSTHPGFYVAPVRGIATGRVHALSAWVTGRDTSGFTRISLAWFDKNSVYLRTDSSRGLPAGTSGWTLLTVEAEAPDDAEFVELHLQSSNNRGTVWFDEVTFS